jgi:uncharacterized coiled-coil DUF342 family protein
MPRVIGFLSVAELRTQLTQLLEQRAAIDERVAKINEQLQEFENDRAPAKWWYPA